MKEQEQGIKLSLSERLNFIGVVKGILLSYVMILPLFLIFAFILTYTDFPEKYVTFVVVMVTLVSVLFAGIIATKNIKSRGMFQGGVVGFLYYSILFLLSSLFSKKLHFDKQTLLLMIIAILAGSIGGIIGMNRKQKKKLKIRRVKK